ncbi:MAG: neuraminidase-like domain-containing protein [Caldilineaceae bacterium]
MARRQDHLFQELESTLLQGDVTNQLAEDALYVYLKKLDQLARLEIVTMYAEEQPLAPPILHVIGRTYTLPHQYFYRRYAHQMWTAWEPISAEIDGQHLVAVMWRERLHLFWLNLTEKVEQSNSVLSKVEDAVLVDIDRVAYRNELNPEMYKLTEKFDAPPTPPPSKKKETLTEMSFDSLVSSAGSAAHAATRRILDIQLNWSEYFQGSWTTRESSGFGHEIDITGKSFSADKLFISVSVEPDSDGLETVNIHLHSESFSSPRLPRRQQKQPPAISIVQQRRTKRSLFSENQNLQPLHRFRRIKCLFCTTDCDHRWRQKSVRPRATDNYQQGRLWCLYAVAHEQSDAIPQRRICAVGHAPLLCR